MLLLQRPGARPSAAQNSCDLQCRVQGTEAGSENSEGEEEGLHHGLPRAAGRNFDAGRFDYSRAAAACRAHLTAGDSASAAPATIDRKRASRAVVEPGASACGDGYAHLPTNHTANQFCDEAQAKARCGGTPVVWVNTSSKVYHLAAQRTKIGAYECQTDAAAEGDRQTKNGQQTLAWLVEVQQFYDVPR